MILICGIPTEPPIARVLDQLQQLHAPTIVFNQREFESCRLAWSVIAGRVSGWLVVDGHGYDLESIIGVYARLMDDRLLPELDDEPEDSARRRHCRQLHDQLVAWMDVAPGRVVNRVRMMGSNGSKPYQAQLIRRHGFRVPETLVTNDAARARDFCTRHGRVVFKSVSGIRSVVAEVSASDLDRLDAVKACPVQFQAYVPGFDVRVHTVGDEVFATRIDSPGTDYRYAAHDSDGTRLEPFDIPDDLARRCCRLSAALGLPFAGIDLRITPGGDVYCFEANPSPAYSYYEAHTYQPIAHAVARYLMGGEHCVAASPWPGSTNYGPIDAVAGVTAR
jgi:RimK-like ATP-grasp domain